MQLSFLVRYLADAQTSASAPMEQSKLWKAWGASPEFKPSQLGGVTLDLNG